MKTINLEIIEELNPCKEGVEEYKKWAGDRDVTISDILENHPSPSDIFWLINEHTDYGFWLPSIEFISSSKELIKKWGYLAIRVILEFQTVEGLLEKSHIKELEKGILELGDDGLAYSLALGVKGADFNALKNLILNNGDKHWISLIEDIENKNET